MTSNIKRLTALAVAQCGSFVIVLAVGVFGGSGHHAPTVHTHTPTPVVRTHTPTPAPTAANTHGGTGGRGASPAPSATKSKTTTPPGRQG